jgi:hypothetical protein
LRRETGVWGKGLKREGHEVSHHELFDERRTL